MLATKLGFDHLDRPTWDLYLMNMAFAASLRSLDPRTKVGSVFVNSEDYSILVTGYNSPCSGCEDVNIPLHASTDPNEICKYDFFSHSEESGVCKAARNGVALKNSILYTTARPCHVCLRQLLNAGVKEIVWADTKPVCVNDKSIAVSNQMLEGRRNIIYREFRYYDGLMELNNKYLQYLSSKNIIKSGQDHVASD